jgi:hypothetical protein
MLVLFDQSTPVPIRPFLKGHTVETAWQRGWDELKNGDLLKAAEEAGFEVLVTPDKNIRYQQNLRNYTIAIVVLANPAMARVASSCGSSRGSRKRCKARHLLRG